MFFFFVYEWPQLSYCGLSSCPIWQFFSLNFCLSYHNHTVSSKCLWKFFRKQAVNLYSSLLNNNVGFLNNRVICFIQFSCFWITGFHVVYLIAAVPVYNFVINVFRVVYLWLVSSSWLIRSNHESLIFIEFLCPISFRTFILIKSDSS